MPYNGRYSVRPERKEEQEAADLHLFWVRPESEKVHQKLRGAAFRVLREEKTTEIRFSLTYGKLFHQLREIVSELHIYLWKITSDAHQSFS